MKKQNISIVFETYKSEEKLEKYIKVIEKLGTDAKKTLGKLNTQTLENRVRQAAKNVLAQSSKKHPNGIGGKWRRDFINGFIVTSVQDKDGQRFSVDHNLISTIGLGRRKLVGKEAKQRMAFHLLINGCDDYKVPSVGFMAEHAGDPDRRFLVLRPGQDGEEKGPFWDWQKKGPITIKGRKPIKLMTKVQTAVENAIEDIRKELKEVMGVK